MPIGEIMGAAIGGVQNRKARRQADRHHQDNLQLQHQKHEWNQHLSKHGIQYAAADARAAGIHPSAMMGSQGHGAPGGGAPGGAPAPMSIMEQAKAGSMIAESSAKAAYLRAQADYLRGNTRRPGSAQASHDLDIRRAEEELHDLVEGREDNTAEQRARTAQYYERSRTFRYAANRERREIEHMIETNQYDIDQNKFNDAWSFIERVAYELPSIIRRAGGYLSEIVEAAVDSIRIEFPTLEPVLPRIEEFLEESAERNRQINEQMPYHRQRASGVMR